MKKNFLKALSITCTLPLFLFGCATVSDVKDDNGKNIYFEELASFEGQVAQIGDYLYYSSGYFSVNEEGFNYNSAKNLGHLVRLDVSENFEYGDGFTSKTNSTPNGIEIVNSDLLIGYDNQNMYALGEYLYFTSANQHKTNEMKNDYSQVSLFRVKFNGDSLKEIGTFQYDENSEIVITEGSDGSYYYVISTPATTEEDSADDLTGKYDVFSIKVGDSIGKKKTLAKAVDSVVIPDENSSIKEVYYTCDAEQDKTTTAVKAVDIATGDERNVDDGVSTSTTTLIDRIGDVIFYSYSYKAINQVYTIDISSQEGSFNPSENQKFYDATTILNIEKVGDGYVFMGSESGSLMYKEIGSVDDADLLATSADFSDILFAENSWVYLSNATGISRVSVVDGEKEEIATSKEMISGKCGYAGGYIYYYSVLAGQDSSSEDYDGNYYLHRTDKNGSVELIGKTI